MPDPTHGPSSAVLMRQDLHFAKSSYFPCNEAIAFVINALLGRQAKWATLFR
jgi:hypothetical protein